MSSNWYLPVGENLPALAYGARLQALRDHRIGLWGVLAQAHRERCLDGNIRAHAGNDLSALFGGLPALEAIAFNGTAAARIGERILGPPAQCFRIPAFQSSCLCVDEFRREAGGVARFASSWKSPSPRETRPMRRECYALGRPRSCVRRCV